MTGESVKACGRNRVTNTDDLPNDKVKTKTSLGSVNELWRYPQTPIFKDREYAVHFSKKQHPFVMLAFPE